MATSNIVDFPGGALAYREYDALLSDGTAVTLAITLGDFDVDSEPARLAHEHNALAFGLVSIVDGSLKPGVPVVWMVDATTLFLAAEEGAAAVAGEVQTLIELYLPQFFSQMAAVAPQLDGLLLGPASAANDNDDRPGP